MEKFRNEAVRMYLALMFTLLPLYYSDNYYDIMNDKKYVFMLFSKMLIAVTAVSLAVSAAAELHKKRKTDAGKARRDHAGAALRRGNPLDVPVLFFAAATLLSLYGAPDLYAAWSGAEAWGVGAYAVLLGTAVYFAVSGWHTGKRGLLVYPYLGSLAVVLIGIADRLGHDVLLMHDEIPLQYDIFISTIGNVNFYAAWLSMILPFFMTVTTVTESRARRAFLHVFLFAAWFGMFVTLTDTSWPGVGAGALITVWHALRDGRRTGRLAAEGITFAAAGAAAAFLTGHPGITARPPDTDTVALFLLGHGAYAVPGILGAALLSARAAAGRLPEEKRTKFTAGAEKIRAKARAAYPVLIAAGIACAAVYVVRHFDFGMFNHRGSIWYFAFRGFLDGGLRQKLTGIGPGLLDRVTRAQIEKADFFVEWDYLYNTAHNDLLEYLVTTGIPGCAARALLYVVPFVMYAKGEERKDEKAAALAALTGFLGQGLVTGPYILTHALHFIFLGMMGAYCRPARDGEAEGEAAAPEEAEGETASDTERGGTK